MNPSASPLTPGGPTDLKIRVEDGSGTSQTWTLTCDPPAGDHPDPAAACAALAAHGAAALPAVRKDMACTDQYGGPEKATVVGTYQGQTGAEFVLPDQRLRDQALGPAEGSAAPRRHLIETAARSVAGTC